MRIAELFQRCRSTILIIAVGMACLAAPRAASALVLDIDETSSRVFVAGQIETYEPADQFNVDVVGLTWVYEDFFIPDVSANLGFGEYFSFVVLDTVASALPDPNGNITTNDFDVELQFWDPFLDPNNPQSTTIFSIFLTTEAIASVSCGTGSDIGSYGEPVDSRGNFRLEGIACIPSLPGVLTNKFVNIEFDLRLLPMLPPAGMGALLVLLLGTLRRSLR